MTVAPRFELLLPEPGTARALAVGDWLSELAPGGSPPFEPHLVFVSMALGDGSRSVWDPRMPVGDPDRTVLQIEAAADRLEGGEDALWRIAVDDAEHGHFLRFTPRGDDAVDIDSFFLSRSPEASFYPVSDDDWEVEQLYASVRETPSDPEPPDANWSEYTWRLDDLDRAATIEALRREAGRLREVLARAGREPQVRGPR